MTLLPVLMPLLSEARADEDEADLEHDINRTDVLVGDTNLEPECLVHHEDEPTKEMDDGDDVQIINEPHTELPVDSDSPFPDLELGVTGNIPVIVVKDMRLKQGPKVLLNRFDLSVYEDHLLPPSSIWTRVNLLMIKEELLNQGGEFDKDLDCLTQTAPWFFEADGETLPVQLDSSISDIDEGELLLDLCDWCLENVTDSDNE